MQDVRRAPHVDRTGLPEAELLQEPSHRVVRDRCAALDSCGSCISKEPVCEQRDRLGSVASTSVFFVEHGDAELVDARRERSTGRTIQLDLTDESLLCFNGQLQKNPPPRPPAGSKQEFAQTPLVRRTLGLRLLREMRAPGQPGPQIIFLEGPQPNPSALEV